MDRHVRATFLERLHSGRSFNETKKGITYFCMKWTTINIKKAVQLENLIER